MVESSIRLELDQLNFLERIFALAQTQLGVFANDPEFDQKMLLAFSDSLITSELQELQVNWQNGDLGDFPTLEVISSSEINGASGAYAAAADRIYLSRELLAQNAGNAEAVAKVLLEEYGHALDTRINSTDAPGDEGEILALLVQRGKLNGRQLLILKTEDDVTTLMIDGENINVEMSTSVEVTASNGITYNITTVSGPEYAPFVNDLALLTQVSPWYNDPDLALELTEALFIDGRLGFPNPDFGVSGIIAGPYFLTEPDVGLITGDPFDVISVNPGPDYFSIPVSGGIFNNSNFVWARLVSELSTSPLVIGLAQGEFEDIDGDGDLDAPAGAVVFIGREDGIDRMLRIVGSRTEYDENGVTITGGTVFSLLAGVSEPLFSINGSLTLPFVDNPTANITEAGNTPDQFKLAGLDYNVSSISILPNEFRLGGNFSLPSDFAGAPFEVELSQPDTVVFRSNGVSLGSSGSVRFPDREFTLLELLEVESSDLEISYTAPSDTLKIQGELEVEPFVRNSKSTPELVVDITNDNSIEIIDGKVDGRVTLSVEDIELADWELGASVTIDTLANPNNIEGTASITFPFGKKSTRRRNKDLDSEFSLKFNTEPELEPSSLSGQVVFPIPIPVFTTGFVLNEVNGGLENLAPSSQEPVEFRGGVKLTGGPKVRGRQGLINLDLTAIVNSESVTGQGRVSIGHLEK